MRIRTVKEVSRALAIPHVYTRMVHWLEAANMTHITIQGFKLVRLPEVSCDLNFTCKSLLEISTASQNRILQLLSVSFMASVD